MSGNEADGNCYDHNVIAVGWMREGRKRRGLRDKQICSGGDGNKLENRGR